MKNTDCLKCGGKGFFIPKSDFRGAMIPDYKHPQNCARCHGTGDEPDIIASEKKEWKFRIGAEWDDIRTFDEICDASKFTYFWCWKGEDRLAPGDNGKPHVVLEEMDGFLSGVTIETNGGIVVDGEFSAGKEFVHEVSKEFDLYLTKDARKAIAAYLIQSNSEEFILEVGDD